MVKIQGLWSRVTLEQLGEIEVTVRLTDLGQQVLVRQDQLRNLLGGLMQVPPFCYCVRLGGVIPAGGGEWTQSAIEKLKLLLLNKTQVYFMSESCLKDQALAKWEGNLIVLERDCSRPLEVEKVIKVSATDCLLELGLALPVKVCSKFESQSIELSHNQVMII